MKINLVSVLSTAILLSGGLVSVAAAQDAEINTNVKLEVGARASVNATSTEAREKEDEDRDNATGTVARTSSPRGNPTSTEAKEGERGNETSTRASVSGQLTAEAHRSEVASFVRSLLDVADREGGIGAEVRVVAQSQSDSASTTERAIVNVEGRNKLLALLIGSDFRSLGQLRSEMSVTANNIAQLEKLIERTTDASDRATLSAQIQILKDSQLKVEAFVQAKENAFSFLGWFVKLFVK